MKSNSKMNRNGSMKGKQGRKDSRDRRVNYDNTRESKFDKDIKSSKKDTSRASNDVSWYARNPELLMSAASLAFSSYTGQKLPISGNFTFPGVCEIDYDISLGGFFEQDTINYAAQSIYSYTVHANSRNTSYNQADEMMVILAGNEIFRALANAIRAYGVMKTFDQRNAYTPRTLIHAMGFNYDSLKDNLSTMWFDINQWIARSQQIWIPNTLPFITRQFWMNSHVYIDGDSVKGQYYVFHPTDFYQYNPTGTTTGGSLDRTSWNQYSSTATGCTWNQFQLILESMFDALLTDEDRGLIFGDILKAYGTDKLYALSEISADYRVIPVYDQEVLTQINNLTSFLRSSGGNIIQDANGLISKQSTFATNTLDSNCTVPDVVFFNFFNKANPTPADVMVASRLTMGGAYYAVVNDTTAEYRPYTCGTEQVTGLKLWMINPNNTNGWQNVSLIPSNFNANTLLSADLDKLSLTLGGIGMYQTFDWAPLIYVNNTTASPAANAGTYTPYVTIGDVDNVIDLPVNTLRKMHDTAVFSLYGVPTL